VEAWAAVVHVNAFAPLSGDSLKILFWYVIAIGGPAAGTFLAVQWATTALQGHARTAIAKISLILTILVVASFAYMVHERFYDWSDLLRDHLALILFLMALAICGLLARRIPPGPLVSLIGVVAIVISLSRIEFTGNPNASSSPARQRSTQPPPHDGMVMIIGVDGLSWDALQRWSRQPKQDYQWLQQRAYSSPLSTIRPTASPEIWTTIATGGRPGDHGVIGFRSWQVDGLTAPRLRVPRLVSTRAWAHAAVGAGWAEQPLVSTYDQRMQTVWDILAENAQTVVSIGWWATWPAQPTNGFVVSDRFYFYRDAAFSPDLSGVDQGITYPPQLAPQIEPLRRQPDKMPVELVAEFLGKTPTEVQSLPKAKRDQPSWFDPVSELRFGYTLDQTHEAIALDFLARQQKLGFLGVYLRGVDLVSHAAMCHSNLYPECEVSEKGTELYGELVSRYYADAFARVRRLVEAAPEGTIAFIVSDHGFELEGSAAMDHHHAPPGTLMVVGATPQSTLDPQPSVYDIAPTILWLKGLPAGEDMPGRPLVELFPSFPPRQIARVPTYGYRAADSVTGARDLQQTDEQMKQLLRTLGYIN
jgi:predicted AlkP superfamily phosphohydrolase/phosphomutase